MSKTNHPLRGEPSRRDVKPGMNKGFTLIEVMVVVAIVAILAGVALPSYLNHLIRASRIQAQTEMLDMGSLEEKIYLNANAYTSNVTAAYDGKATGGLGKTSGKSKDARYTYSVSVGASSQSFVLTATPVAGTQQASDGNLSLSETGQKLWLKASGTVGW